MLERKRDEEQIDRDIDHFGISTLKGGRELLSAPLDCQLGRIGLVIRTVHEDWHSGQRDTSYSPYYPPLEVTIETYHESTLPLMLINLHASSRRHRSDGDTHEFPDHSSSSPRTCTLVKEGAFHIHYLHQLILSRLRERMDRVGVPLTTPSKALWLSRG